MRARGCFGWRGRRGSEIRTHSRRKKKVNIFLDLGDEFPTPQMRGATKGRNTEEVEGKGRGIRCSVIYKGEINFSPEYHSEQWFEEGETNTEHMKKKGAEVAVDHLTQASVRFRSRGKTFRHSAARKEGRRGGPGQTQTAIHGRPFVFGENPYQGERTGYLGPETRKEGERGEGGKKFARPTTENSVMAGGGTAKVLGKKRNI